MIIDILKGLFSFNCNANIDVNQLVFVDLETTGLFTNRCGILEICIVDSSDNTFSTLVDVGQPIPGQITEINGIDRDMIAGKPMFSDIAHQVYDLIKDKTIVGHNVEFDLKFLFHGFLSAGIQPKPLKYICTCNAERKKRGQPGNRLDECLLRRGVRIEQQHRAHDDVLLLRQLFDFQMNERTKLSVEVFNLNKYKQIILQEPEPKFTQKPPKRTTHTLRSFDGWGTKTDKDTIAIFNQLIEEACQDRIFDADEMRRLSEIGIAKKVAVQQLKTALSDLAVHYYRDYEISWDEFRDLEDIANLFGFNSSVFYPLIKQVVPELKVICFTNDLIIKGKPVDRFEALYPWAVSNRFLPCATVTKQTDLVVNCGAKNSVTGKLSKAVSYGIEVKHISEIMKGKKPLVT
jgi:DNA polymerase III epsilon subunit family exonuclease